VAACQCGCPWGVGTCAFGAQRGHLAVLQWARANGCPWDARTCSEAAGGGHLAVLQWYGMIWYGTVPLLPPVSVFCGWWRHAVSIRSVSDTDRQCSPRLFGDGFVPVMLALEKNGTEVACIRRSHWAYRCDAPASRCQQRGGWTTRVSAPYIDSSVLQWARANGCPWDAGTCSLAANDGHLAVLQWLRANGCPWDWKVAHSAAREPHTAVLDWARANGCPELRKTAGWGRQGLCAWQRGTGIRS
jgi:hypothetical protein